MLRDITIQEAKQKQEAERQLDLERKQAEASSEELKRKLEELKKQLQERDAQVKPLYMSSEVALTLMIHLFQIETLKRRKV